MLKISVEDDPVCRRVIVEGKLTAPWVAELRAAYEDSLAVLGGRELLVELKDVVVISQEGENTLAELIARGTKVQSSGVFTRYILEKLTQRRPLGMTG